MLAPLFAHRRWCGYATLIATEVHLDHTGKSQEGSVLGWLQYISLHFTKKPRDSQGEFLTLKFSCCSTTQNLLWIPCKECLLFELFVGEYSNKMKVGVMLTFYEDAD